MAITDEDVNGLNKVRAFLEGGGTAAGDVLKAEDAAHTSGDSGVFILGVRNANRATLADTELDYAPLAVSHIGAALTNLVDAATGNNATFRTGGVIQVEQAYSFVNLTADTAVKSGAGTLHTITLSSDAAATAGTLILYDNTAESGTVIATISFIAAYLAPVTLIFNAAFATGLYAGLTTTADVSITVAYR